MTHPSAQNAHSIRLAQDAPGDDPSLDELQVWMAQLIVHDKALDRHEDIRAAAARHFTGNDRLSPAEQIEIYRVQFWLRHLGVLLDHFDGLSRWLGQERFQTVAESYLRRPSSSVFALSDLGHEMPQHIADLEGLPDRAFCVDMARLEWAYQSAFSAMDDPVLSLDKLQAIPAEAWAGARFTVSESLYLLELNYPVFDVRRKLKEDQPVDRNEALLARKIYLAVYRRERIIYDKQLSEPAFLLLAELQRGTPLIPACEAVVERCPHAEDVFEQQLMHWFALWGQLGWIVDVLVD